MSIGGDYVLLGWVALSVTNDVIWVGIAFAVYYIPMIILGIPSGGIADRIGRFTLLRCLELLSVISLVLLAWMFWAMPQGYVHLFLLAVLLGSVRATYYPTRLSYAYDLAGQDQAIASLAGISVAARVGMIPGALLVGYLANSYGAGSAFLFMAASSFLALMILGKKQPKHTTQVIDPSPIFENLKKSIIEVRRNQLLLALILITAAIELLGISFMSVLPNLESERLGVGVEALGWMNASQAAGGLIAGVIMFVLPKSDKNSNGFFISIVILGIAVLVLGYVTSLVSMLLVLAVISAMIVVWDIFTQSMMQNSVPENLRGRAMGAWVLAIGSAPLGHLEIGFLAAAIGVNMSLMINGFGVVFIALLFFIAVPALRRL